MMLETYIKKIEKNTDLSIDESCECLLKIFSGQCQTEEIIALLINLQKKGESIDEIVGFAKAMKQKMAKINLFKECIDICGTGGTSRARFNISTSVAFILAAAGVPVAKHGNKGSRESNGSFDFLEALAIKYDFDISYISQIFKQTNLCFLFARNHHMAMKHVAQARKEISGRTIFNILGPLCNPAEVQYQIIGALSEEVAEKIAAAIQVLGTKKSLVIVGGGNVDEISISDDSIIYEVTSKSIEKYIISPQDYDCFAKGKGPVGGLAADNAQYFKNLISKGVLDNDTMRMILINAGAAFYCCGKASSILKGVQLAKEQISSLSVWRKYQEYRNASNAMGKPRVGLY
jgi:anthranilate phosphoribosyltransferase